MPPAVAAAGVGVVGSLISSNSQSKANKQAAALQGKQLEFQQERYDDWKAVYGDLQESMGDYYKNLTGKDLSNREVQDIQLASQKAQEKIDTALAQRGIEGSGLQADLTSKNIIGTEMAKATSRATAEQRANDAKLNFLRVGLGQGNNIANSIGNTQNNLANLAIQQGQNSATTAGTITGFISEGLNQYNRDNGSSSASSLGLF